MGDYVQGRYSEQYARLAEFADDLGTDIGPIGYHVDRALHDALGGAEPDVWAPVVVTRERFAPGDRYPGLLLMLGEEFVLVAIDTRNGIIVRSEAGDLAGGRLFETYPGASGPDPSGLAPTSTLVYAHEGLYHGQIEHTPETDFERGQVGRLRDALFAASRRSA